MGEEAGRRGDKGHWGQRTAGKEREEGHWEERLHGPVGKEGKQSTQRGQKERRRRTLGRERELNSGRIGIQRTL